MADIEIIRADITKLEVDAIVNAANNSLLGGGGVDGAIHREAGAALLRACAKLGGCATGQAKITAGFNLIASHIIHTVGPIWTGGNNGEAELLTSCYVKSLQIAVANNCTSIAFPNISTGVYGFPKVLAADIAITTINNFLQTNSVLQKIIFCCYDSENFDIYQTRIGQSNN